MDTSNFALHRERDEDDDDETQPPQIGGVEFLPGRSRGIRAYLSRGILANNFE